MNDHPKNIYLPEAAVIDPLNQWLGELFAPEHIDQTVAALVASQHQGGNAHSARDAAKRRLDTAETRLRRLQSAIEAGADPAAFVEAINEAQSQRAAARAELDGTPAPDALTDAEVYAMIDSLGDVGEALNDAKPEKLEKLYEALRLEMTYNAPTGQVDVAIRPARRVSACVRGATCTLITRLDVMPDLVPEDALRLRLRSWTRNAWGDGSLLRETVAGFTGP